VINWLLQILELTWFNLRTIPERKGAAVTSAVGIAGVVTVLIGVLSIGEGFLAAMKAAGAEDVAIVLRSGADTELTSGMSREETRLITDAPGIARSADGPLASAELFVIIDLPKRATNTDANVSFRGVGAMGVPIRDGFRLVAGRLFQPGRNEVIVGTGTAETIAGLELNRPIRLGQYTWNVVGIFSGGGGAAESEIWTDAAVLQSAYHRGESFQSVYAKLTSPSAFPQFKDALTTNPRLKVRVLRQSEFLAEQSTMLVSFIRGFGVSIAGLMALGALFGALNTMYSAVAARIREIATLRALGFRAGPVICSVMFESLVLALLGGGAGAAVAYLVFDGYKATTINWQTFSQVAFSFSVTPQLLLAAVAWAAAIGLVGGLFPAIRAARLPIALALREM
jgi:putative ABC transport system permease protein